MSQLCRIMATIMSTIMSVWPPIISTIMSNYVTLFQSLSHYSRPESRVSPPGKQQLADTQTRPMHSAMADKWLGGPGVPQGGKDSSRDQDKSLFSADSTPLYSLCVLLYSLFCMSDQGWAAGNLNLSTAHQCTMNLCDTPSNLIKMKAVNPVQSVLFHSYYSHYVTII